MSLTLPFDSFVATPDKRKRPRAWRFDLRRFEASGLALLPRIVRVRERVESLEVKGEYVSPEGKRDLLLERACKRGQNGQDPRENLPILPEDTASTLAKRYGATKQRLEQALALHSHNLHGKAKRLVLCGRLGRRIDHQKSLDACDRKFSEPYHCREKYCTFCGPQQFRELFAKLLNALTPVVDRLLCEGVRRGREMVTAKLDFTVPNDHRMPRPEEVREFHAAMRRFWRLAERIFGIKRSEYGVVRNDEFGGANTNLHGHCAYVGPRLPQKRKELSALWSIVLLPKERSQRRRELMRFVRKYGLAELWDQLAPDERRFVSIKRSKSFAGALAHALKYPAKFLDKSSPQRLAALEKTFHKTRRVSTGGAFYRITELREPGEDREFDHAFCPFCKVRLVRMCEPWQPISVLESEGRINLRTAEREAGLHNALGGESPP
jgi:hypothetical protein